MAKKRPNTIHPEIINTFCEMTIHTKSNKTTHQAYPKSLRHCIFALLITLFTIPHVYAANIVLETSHFSMAIDEKGFVVSFHDKNTRQEYVPNSVSSPLLSIQVAGETINPTAIKKDRDAFILSYPSNGIEARISYETNPTYLSFELTAISHAEDIELVIWGPYPTNIEETIGESVGVVRNEQFALGIQALNVKTLGGYPSEESDIEPSYDIFETGNLKDIDEAAKGKILYRGQTAKATDFGSVLQAYCRNRHHERIIPNWDHTHYTAPAYDDGGIIGSKIALFGCPPEKALDIIGTIELAEGLPHPLIDGQWAKTTRLATASYLIINFGEDDLDKAIELTQQAGLGYLYHGHPFKTWGHFVLDEKAFPQQWASLKRCVERAEKEGIKLGVHTLSNFITTNDAYVSPIPDKRLAKVGTSTLTGAVAADADEIPIESPTFFNQMANNSLRAVVIGNEIIQYQDVSESAPWRLIGCTRGAFNTEATAHQRGDTIGKLMDHGYRVFLSDAELSDEIAINIANLFNETGLMQVSFDGLEGVWATGMGQYARNLFTKTWYDHLKPELQGNIINDASNPSHYNWHINTRYNWGEPWYAGFRESQTHYRLMNQDFYRRNLLPAMLGWFSMSAQTSIEDTEWLLARAAGFDAGFAFNVSFDAVENNGQSDAILKSIKNWEAARMAGAFTQEQRLRMEDIENEFHLEPTGAQQWSLYPYHIQRFEHQHKIRQPGEPVFSEFSFENPYEAQSPSFILTLLPDAESDGGIVEKIVIEIGNNTPVEIPVQLKPSQKLKVIDGNRLEVFDRNWNILETVELEHHIPHVSTGRNTMVFDMQYTGSGHPKLHIEAKTMGPAEALIANTNP